MEKEESKARVRLKAATAAMLDIIERRLKSATSGKRTKILVARQEVDNLIRDWPPSSKKAALEMLQKYGEPNEASTFNLIWYDNQPWKWTKVIRDEIPHNFPLPHNDVLLQTINYKLPVEMAADILAFNGSIIIDRTAGEISVHGDSEVNNFLIINLMNEIILRKLTVAQARIKYTEDTIASLLNQKVPYTDKFHFECPSGDTSDLDQTMVTEAMLREASERIERIIKPEA